MENLAEHNCLWIYHFFSWGTCISFLKPWDLTNFWLVVSHLLYQYQFNLFSHLHLFHSNLAILSVHICWLQNKLPASPLVIQFSNLKTILDPICSPRYYGHRRKVLFTSYGWQAYSKKFGHPGCLVSQPLC